MDIFKNAFIWALIIIVGLATFTAFFGQATPVVILVGFIAWLGIHLKKR